ncbi:hotdog fold thioesterase [Cryobacterium sp. TMT1-62]|uniref:Hotdog fold thioesterase n=1 Tax=Cryobacterium sandaracinum TaxID=1259247 RepID=A0ABY2JM53_9MICO|nr:MULTISPECIES: hotdog fold thioesterase [Cryobacterium]TFB53723.1 hotdog fold thioesterase [Cryobacterium sp. Sr3]TFB57958.1 hotdog fold thioesterase [Cryobacterium sp. Hz7]TFC49295.1 hotdog fold thioesterase [Cryobacterium sp. TMT2-17-1]TFC68848.1 hotdog fold thioesterase [Cryobacterium sp. TMT2-4]TFD07283.1 hotdog fold thioesterase [Cryobacterium sandaracinum]
MIQQTTDALEWVQQRGAGSLAEKMGIEFVEFTIERAVARMPVEGNTQPAMLLHGGAYVVLGESLGSMAANLHAGPGRLAVGIEINATHTRSATSGFVTGVCTPVHLGRTLTTHEIAVTDDQGRRCSTIRITNLIKELTNRPEAQDPRLEKRPGINLEG